MAPTPVTVVTGFLGSGKTTLILNLIPQLPSNYKFALLKNEFGNVEIDSQLAKSSSILGVRELLNGCICCNLVGQLGDALETLRSEQNPNRIIVETSGSAFPATIALEVNRLARESNGEHFVLDGVISVIDVENWEGYEDTSVTAKMQARYTDFVVFNKWESVSERRFDECLDRLGDLELQTPYVKSNMGVVGKDVLLGIDGALARTLTDTSQKHHGGEGGNHQSEVEGALGALDQPSEGMAGVDLSKLATLLNQAPKDEVYRIKAVLYASSEPKSSDEGSNPTTMAAAASETDRPTKYILNWAFKRWTFTAVPGPNDDAVSEPAIRMTLIFAKYESAKWKKRLEENSLLALDGPTLSDVIPRVEKIA